MRRGYERLVQLVISLHRRSSCRHSSEGRVPRVDVGGFEFLENERGLEDFSIKGCSVMLQFIGVHND